MIKISSNPDGSKTARHALLSETVTFDPTNEAAVLQTMNAKAAGVRVQIAEVARVGRISDLEALVRQRGGDRNAVNMLRNTPVVPKIAADAHRLDGLISDLDARGQKKLPATPAARLAMFAKEIRDREQQPEPEAAPPKVSDAINQMERLKDHLIHHDAHDPSRLVRVELTLRQLRNGDAETGFGMMASVLDGEKQLAAERKTAVAMRQDELRQQAADLDAYSNGLEPIPADVAEVSHAE
ncbi:hypothetical protein [Botrimarina mediterranea]|uniref:Uncharacterized protein n=1 Tax=Botrimarina mediterranea TaxID=2528022 RepID=A0A518K5J7_9BACT|nr:hypothetical protein [Botrimarina mediterranea]QDV73070.1 hypothetical protein Spa11_12590 [Botrimarina mediterranea]